MQNMRSFLIRDILSGSAAPNVGGGGGLMPTASAAATATRQGDQAEKADQVLVGANASSFADYNVAAQNLAATQARFLAKWAEHQHQQVNATKYLEQLQQQHQQHPLSHQQLLTSFNLSQHFHRSQQHQNVAAAAAAQLQLHQQALSALGPAAMAAALNGAHSAVAGLQGPQQQQILSQHTKTAALGQKTKKSPSFAYDCTSPISSTSSIAAAAINPTDTKCRRGGGRRALGQAGGSQSADGFEAAAGDDNDDETDNNDDDDDICDDEEDDDCDADESRDEDEEIEVEKVSADETVARKKSNRRPKERRANSTSPTGAGGSQSGQQRRTQFQQQINSPLDALFQMTSSTLDVLKRGDKRKERDEQHGNSSQFANGKQASNKKKRKSRTAFTNNQIYELERRFRLQKYLSPTDRDEIAMTLNLSNAQVITWFQNRRAKMKRDQEELRRDQATLSFLNLEHTLMKSFQALSQMGPAAIQLPPTESLCASVAAAVNETKAAVTPTGANVQHSPLQHTTNKIEETTATSGVRREE